MKKRILLTLGLCMVGIGCPPPIPPQTPNAGVVFRHADKKTMLGREYIIDPPDMVTVHARNIAEMPATPQQVAPDGTLTYALLGSVLAAGRTTKELAADLRQRLDRFYKDPDVQVEAQTHSKFIYVFGPGAVRANKQPFTGRNTVIATIADAGFTDSAWPQKVVLNRPRELMEDPPNEPIDDESKAARAIVDFMQIQREGRTRQNYLLEAGDILYLSRDPLSNFAFNMGKVLGIMPPPHVTPLPLP